MSAPFILAPGEQHPGAPATDSMVPIIAPTPAHMPRVLYVEMLTAAIRQDRPPGGLDSRARAVPILPLPTEVESPRYGGSGSRLSPFWVRNLSVSP